MRNATRYQIRLVPGRLALSCVSAMSLIACAGCTIPVERHDWSTYDGPGAEHLREPQYQLPFQEDPLEPVNRVALGLNSAIVVGIAEPVASGWRQLVPQEARTHLVQAAKNLEYPRRGLNHLLQGDTEKAASETQRFAINSTAGIVGLNDVAREKGVRPSNTDTGMTLKKWGWDESTYLALPFGMPGTSRDVVGGVGDLFLDPTFYFFPAAPIKGFIQAAERMDGIERFITTNQDPYEPMRRMYMASREVVDIAPMDSGDEGTATQTMAYAMLSPRDPGFDLKGRTRRVRVNNSKRRFPYDVWMQDAPAPMVILLPGFGGHRESYQNMAIAEMFYDAGYSVATISSVANFEFMRRAATARLPGFAPRDAEDVHRALSAVTRDLKSEYGDRITKRALVGTSFGGGHALFIAAQAPASQWTDFDAYLAICPPIQFAHAASALDSFYNIPLEVAEDLRDVWAIGAIQKAGRLALGGSAIRRPVEISENEAAFLVGLSYRLALHDLIWVSREQYDANVLRTDWNDLQRASASQEILDYSLMKYAYAFLLPELKGDSADARDAASLFARCDVRMLEGRLRSKANVGVAFNENDFLLATGDAAWLMSAFGSQRLAVSPTGGHLGNLGDDAWRSEIVALLEQLLVDSVADID